MQSNKATLALSCLGLALGVLVPRLSAGQAPSAPTRPVRPPVFKHSHIFAWFGAEEAKRRKTDLVLRDMDLTSDLNVARWKDEIARLHLEGKKFWGELRPLTHVGRMEEFVMNDPGLQAAVCLDFDLQPIPIGWLTGHLYKGRQANFYCSNHPTFQAFLRNQIYLFAQAGVDGFMVDDGGGAFFAYAKDGCFCPHCQAGFREYLKGKYSVEELKAQGVDDPNKFDYRAFLLRQVANKQAYGQARKEGRLPFTRDFSTYLIRSDAALFRGLYDMVCKLSGKHIPIGWDNVDMAGNRAPYYPFWDVFYPEINYPAFSVSGKGPDDQLSPAIVMLNKVPDALGKWYTPSPAPRAWGSIRDKNLTGLLQQWIVFTYANGGVQRHPARGWCLDEKNPWYYPPMEKFKPIYDFIAKYPELFDDYEAVEQVGVLFTQTAGGGGAPYYTPLKHVCARLVDGNVPFGMAVAGDELLDNRLSGHEAARFELMLVPEPIRLIEGQDKIVERWKADGRAIAVTPDEDPVVKLAGRVQPFVALESASAVWLFPRAATGAAGAPLVCHLVASKYDPAANHTLPQKDVVVRLRASLWAGAAAKKVTYYTIDQAPRELPFDSRDGALRVTVPEVTLWGILKIDR